MWYKRRSRDSIVIVTRLQAGLGTEDFSLSEVFGPVLGPTQAFLQSLQPGALCAEHEADHFHVVACSRMCGTLPLSVICRNGVHKDDFISRYRRV